MRRLLANKLHGSRASIVMGAALAAASILAPSAQARVTEHVAIVAPTAHVVSGLIPFDVRGDDRNLRKIVFKIDGHHRWTATHRPFRFDRSGRLDTRTLTNGTHVLLVNASYANRHVVTSSKRIDVRNPTASVARRHRKPPIPPKPIVPPSLGFVAPPTSGVSGPSPTLFNRQTYSYSSSLSISQEANRYQLLVLQSTDGSKVAALKAANPGLKIFVYQHPWFTRVSDPGALGVCTSYPNDLANHPSWFVHDQYGNNVPTKSGGNYVMDIGNPSYQQACAANAARLAKQYGFDGVYFDGIAPTTRFDVPAGTILPQYPNDTSWQQATTSFLTAAVADLHAQGLQVAGNLCGTALTPGLWQRWSTILDASEEESWTDGGLGPAQQISQWSTKLADAAWSEANGKYTILHSYNTTEAGNSYGLASMLLIADGRTSYSTSNANYTTSEATYPEYATAQSLGAPAGPLVKLGNGVYERPFSKGVVLVNPTAQTVPSFSLAGGIYSGSQLGSVGSVSMAPTSGLILLKVG